MFWLSYECFSILCNAFLLKSAISSHNSCGSIKKISVKEQELRAKPWITKGILKTNLDHKTNLNQQQKQNMDDDDELFLWYCWPTKGI